MKSLTKTQLKAVAKMALKAEFGFTVSKLSDIVLLEADGDGQYILFEVNCNVYRFSSYKVPTGELWVGKGTITRVEED